MRDSQQEQQRQLAAGLRRAEELRLELEQAQNIELSQQWELTLPREQKQSRGQGTGL